MRAETFTTCTTDQTKLWLNSVSATQARVLMTFLDIEPKEALILSWMLIQGLLELFLLHTATPLLSPPPLLH